jgi:type I restriction enzyme S subunit
MSDLPEGWTRACFGDVATIDSNLVSPAAFPEMPHIAPNHIESWSGRLLPYTTVAADNVKSPKHLFKPGQILYSKIRPYLAKAVLVDFAGLCSADMYPVSTWLEPRFLLRWMLSAEFTRRVADDQNRTVLPKINQEALLKIGTPVAPLAEERRIVAKVEALLGRVSGVRERLERVPHLLKRFRQSVLTAACSGRLTENWRTNGDGVAASLDALLSARRTAWEKAEAAKLAGRGKAVTPADLHRRYRDPVTVDDAFEIPPSWVWASLDALTLIAGGVTKGQKRAAGARLRSVPYLRVANVQRGHLDLREIKTIAVTEDEISRWR